MKPLFLTTTLLSVICLVGCKGTTSHDDLITLSVEKAVDNKQAFDISEIASKIEFIALDDSAEESLLAARLKIEESKNRFYIQDGIYSPLKVFDKTGKFISTRGVIGRGPDEFLAINDMTVDYGADNVYLSARNGVQIMPILAYDAAGQVFARNDSTKNAQLSFYADKVISTGRSSGSMEANPANKVPFLEVFSQNLDSEGIVDITDNGSGAAVIYQTENGEVKGISVMIASPNILSNNGKSLLVKEGRGDTVFYFKNDMSLEPAYRFDFGKYTPPAEAFGMNPTAQMGESLTAQSFWEGNKYIFISTMGSDNTGNRILVFDRRNPSEGFSARGDNGKNGLFVGGVEFVPRYVRDNRLVGYISALDLVYNKDSITNPDLALLAQSLNEESNPVVIVVELK